MNQCHLITLTDGHAIRVDSGLYALQQMDLETGRGQTVVVNIADIRRLLKDADELEALGRFLTSAH